MPRKLNAHLVGNALVHARGAERIVADIDRSSVSIRDDGVGISSSIDRDRVEPFLTGDTVSQGTGLGLSIVQKIAHGGTLTIASIPGHGTTASLRFADAS
jgi:signal transduction histidine kinase